MDISALSDGTQTTRVGAKILEHQIDLFARNRLFKQIADELPEMLLILNRSNQVVYANLLVGDFLGLGAPFRVYGLRPGELFRCIHAAECGGCGTTGFCRYCGAAQAIIESRRSRPKMIVMDCSITTGDLDSLELQVYALSWPGVSEEQFTVLLVKDISDLKWRQTMEKIFFHDLLNVLTVLKGMLTLESESPGFSKEELIAATLNTVTELIEEINSHREVIAAGDRRRKTEFRQVSVHELFNSLQILFARIFSEQGKRLTLLEPEADIDFLSDPLLLKRVISNMLKNALEASSAGDEIILSARCNHRQLVMEVRNPGDMPEEVRHQIFHRSFSTKGRNRGLGTYSMKLLTERYLGGKISFSSDAENGTVFAVILPLPGKEKRTDGKAK